MARKTEERVIDGHKVIVGQMPIDDASVCFKKLAALISAAGTKLSGLKLEGMQASASGFMDMDVSMIASALSAGLATLKDDEQRALEQMLLINVRFDGHVLTEPGAVSAHVDALDTYYRVLAFSVQVNFAKAFRGLFAGQGGPAVASG